MGAKGWKMGVWIRTLGFTPYLSSPGLPLSVPSGPGTPRTSSKSRQKTGRLRSHHVSPGLQHPPPSSGQLRGHHVSPGLWLPPPGSGQLRGHNVSPGLRLPPPDSGQLRGHHVSYGRAL
jgi:hypothetical protein